MEKEKRSLKASNLEIRSKEGQKIIQGYAALFDQPVEIMGFKEELKKGCFSEALNKPDLDCRALIDHEPSKVLGRYKKDRTENTLELKEDNKGLWFKIDPLPDTQESKDLIKNIELGNVDQCSFGFVVGSEEWEENQGGIPTRRIKSIESLFDISVVTYPAYPQTSVSVASRKKAEALHNLKVKEIELERLKLGGY